MNVLLITLWWYFDDTYDVADC